jgi:hypothetical protein
MMGRFGGEVSGEGKGRKQVREGIGNEADEFKSGATVRPH